MALGSSSWTKKINLKIQGLFWLKFLKIHISLILGWIYIYFLLPQILDYGLKFYIVQFQLTKPPSPQPPDDWGQGHELRIFSWKGTVFLNLTHWPLDQGHRLKNSARKWLKFLEGFIVSQCLGESSYKWTDDSLVGTSITFLTDQESQGYSNRVLRTVSMLGSTLCP